VPLPSFRSFIWRVVASHVITYFVVGLIAFELFDYRTLYAETELRHLMRSTDSGWVAAGPALQLIRGTLFGLVLWPFVDRIVAERGALHLYGLVLGLAVLGTAGPSPGSLEGVFFTTLPLEIHLVGLPEVVVQTGVFSALLVAWCRKPARWMDIVAIVSIALVVLMSVAGVLASFGIITAS
jgi:hypothetical protein